MQIQCSVLMWGKANRIQRTLNRKKSETDDLLKGWCDSAWTGLSRSPLLPGHYDELGARLWPALDPCLLLLHLDLPRSSAHHGNQVLWLKAISNCPLNSQEAEALPNALVGCLHRLPHSVAWHRLGLHHQHLLLLPTYWSCQPPQTCSLPLPHLSNSDDIWGGHL